MLALTSGRLLSQAATSPRSGNPWQPHWLADPGLTGWLATNLAVAAAYMTLGILVGRFFAAYGLFPAPIWLPASIGCIAAMIGGAGLLPGVFLGSFLVNHGHLGSSVPVALAISLGNAFGPWLGARLTRAMRPAGGLFSQFDGVFGFLLGGVTLHAVVTATVGTLSLCAAGALGDATPLRIWTGWLICDASGTLFVAPALLLWLGVEPRQRARGVPSRVDIAVAPGTLAFTALLFLAPHLGPQLRPEAMYVLTVPLSWVTLRISLRAALTLLTAICVIATLGTVLGHGPFNQPLVPNPMQSVGLLTILCAMNVLTLSALTHERREVAARLSQAVRVTEDLRRRAETDALTGIGNRRFFIEHFNQLLLDNIRPLGLLLIDLDHFKRLNDVFGHAAGDAALVAVARCCAELAPPHAVPARIGGEEFAFILPGMSQAEVRDFAYTLLEAIAGLCPTVGEAGTPVRLTASIGFTGRHALDLAPEDMLRRADTALYAAKAGGRNQVRAG